jgi:hypothetical protein
MDEIGIRMSFDKQRLDKLRRLAKAHGYVLTTSKRVGQGSVKAMLEAVVDDELAIVRTVHPNGDEP